MTDDPNVFWNPTTLVARNNSSVVEISIGATPAAASHPIKADPLPVFFKKGGVDVHRWESWEAYVADIERWLARDAAEAAKNDPPRYDGHPRGELVASTDHGVAYVSQHGYWIGRIRDKADTVWLRQAAGFVSRGHALVWVTGELNDLAMPPRLRAVRLADRCGDLMHDLEAAERRATAAEAHAYRLEHERGRGSRKGT